MREIKFKARPSLSNFNGVKIFMTEQEAVDYLNKITGFSMQAFDWRMIGKLNVI